MKNIYTIDGKKFSNLKEFAKYFSETVLKDYQWKGNLDAFNDILRGGFGTPDDGFILNWINSEISRQKLGYEETERWLEDIIKNCHPDNVDYFRERLKDAKKNKGETLFDKIIEIIKIHGPGGEEEEDGVELILQ